MNAFPTSWHPPAIQLWQQGQAEAAVNAVLRAWEAGPDPDLALQAAYYMFLLGDFKSGIRMLDMQVQRTPEHLEVRMNLAVCCSRAGLPEVALGHAEKALALAPEAATCWDTKAHCLQHLERFEEASVAGTQALAVKDRQARQRKSSVAALSWPAVSPAEFAMGKTSVVAFSLWGDKPRYLRGALRNALLVPELYPGWVCRFHVDDSVPEPFLATLASLGCELVMSAADESLRMKLARRFLVANDPGVGWFVVRDVDSVVNQREAAAVAAWQASGQWFHAMRDWWSHTDLMLAGMWGGVAGVLPDMTAALSAYRSGLAETPNVDQWFLRDEVWPLVSEACLVHDRCFHFGASQAFPTATPAGSVHVGQDEFAAHGPAQARWLAPWIERLACLQVTAGA